MGKTLKVFTAFSGYDSQCMALDRLGINYELFGWSEIDKYAIKAHNAVYPQWSERNFGDISKIDWDIVPDFDLFTYSFPCQDISTAGYQRGLEEGSGTRSSLLWECRKAIEAKRPKYMLMENVKALTGKKFMPYLQKWMDYLGGLGYSNYMKVLNAKNYGVPQNRERTFMVSVLGGGDYNFPEPFELKARLKDVLEPEVEEKYYVSDKAIDYIYKDGGKSGSFKAAVGVQDGSREANSITANYWKIPRQGTYLIESYEEKDIIGVSVNPNSRKLEFKGSKSIKNTCPSLRATDYKCPHTVWESGAVQDYRIRKLTPRECFRLMGVSEDNIDKIQQAGISNSQQYKLAGNSIVVDVLYHIFRKMFIDKKSEYNQLSLF